MGWAISTSWRYHPCPLPGDAEKQRRRVGEFWRCEVCSYLWRLEAGWNGRRFRQATWRERWHMRGQGHTDDKV